MNKRIIYALFYKDNNFYLSRNFRLQKVGNIEWLKNNFDLEKPVITLTSDNYFSQNSPNSEDYQNYFKDVNELRKIFVPITLGGGIRNLDQAKNCF